MDERARFDATARPPGTSVLLLAPDPVAGTDALCDALGPVDDDAAVLVVTPGDVRAAIGGLRERGVSPEAIGVVDVSGTTPLPDGIAEARIVDGPESLSRLGIAVSDALERLSHRFDRVVVGFDATTSVLEANELPAAFRFLHVLIGRVRTEESVLVATMDRSAHDDETRRTIAELFDEIVTVDAA